MTALTVVRLIKARPSIVFNAVTTAEGIVQWWGPDAGPVLIAECDPCRGGRFRVRFRRLDDGVEYESSGEFLEVIPPERVVMSWRWKDGAVDPNESRVEIVLRPVPEGTEITVTHSLLHDEESARSHEAGWTACWDKLAAMFAGVRAA
jgi:uncharacterized protein YndB with AHSA1/START domain